MYRSFQNNTVNQAGKNKFSKLNVYAFPRTGCALSKKEP